MHHAEAAHPSCKTTRLLPIRKTGLLRWLPDFPLDERRPHDSPFTKNVSRTITGVTLRSRTSTVIRATAFVASPDTCEIYHVSLCNNTPKKAELPSSLETRRQYYPSLSVRFIPKSTMMRCNKSGSASSLMSKEAVCKVR